jgi:2-C-methyl-D-erythritol 2,4-cyclodiphosphate synthase
MISMSPRCCSVQADQLRIGQGFDVHPFSDDDQRTLVLGGIRFDGHPGLAGHSDADVVAHACIDAICGACGLGDIGCLFPDTDLTYRGADSIELLRDVAGRADDGGWSVVNIDCTVVLDTPRLAPRRHEMEAVLSEAAGAPVTVKGKSTEGLPGLAGGIQCHAVALAVAR